jgi:hypothetical protein
LLWYIPLLWIALLSVPRWRLRGRLPDFLLAAGTFTTLLFLYALWWDWPGGRAWGPRLMAVTTPAIALMALPLLDELTTARFTWKRPFIGGLLLLSILVQVPGVWVNFSVQEGREFAQGMMLEQRLWDWRSSPLLTHWQSIGTETSDPFWQQPFFWRHPPQQIALLGILGVLALVLPLWRLRQPRAGEWSGWPAISIGAWIGLAATVIWLAAPDPRWHETSAEPAHSQQLWNYLEETVTDSDLVLLDLIPYFDVLGRSSIWMDRAPFPPHYLGWRRKEQFTVTEEERLQKWLAPYGRVWLSLQGTPPGDPGSTTEQWLDRWAYRGSHEWFGTQRLVAYFLPGQAQPRTLNGPFHFGQTVNLAQATVQPGRKPAYRLVELEWHPIEDPDLRFSLQVLDKNGQLYTQIDHPPQSVNRIGAVVPEEGYTLLLKVYHAYTGQPVPLVSSSVQPYPGMLILETYVP